LKGKIAYLLAGAVLAYALYDGYYYYQVLRWVDGVRIQTILQQQAQQKPAGAVKAE
jgi:hypothetical protein